MPLHTFMGPPHVPGSKLPMPTFAHVPAMPGTLHALHTPAHASSQQTPSTHERPPAQVPPPHGSPLHFPHFEPPQSTPVSSPFCLPSSQAEQVCVDVSQRGLSPA